MKKISYDQYLQAQGLFSLMCEHADKATMFDSALGKLLGLGEEPYNYAGHISDACYAGLHGRRPPFDELLKLEGFEIEKPPVRLPMAYRVKYPDGTYDVYREKEAADMILARHATPGDVEVEPLYLLEWLA
jgi:hypothetical protein